MSAEKSAESLMRIPLEKEMATHSSTLAYTPWGRKESDMTKRLHFHFGIYHPFSLASFKIFSLSLIFGRLNIMGLGEVILHGDN